MKLSLRMIVKTIAFCLLLGFLCAGLNPAYADDSPRVSRHDYPKPEITCSGKKVSYIILGSYFNGVYIDTIGYWRALINDEYSTQCNVGDKITMNFDTADKPDKITMQYNPNTMFNSQMLDKTYYYSEPLEIEDGFIIKEEHLNPANKDAMYYLTVRWENGNLLEYCFLILTDENITPIRETKDEPVYVSYKRPNPIDELKISGLQITRDEPEPPEITLTISGYVAPSETATPASSVKEIRVFVDGEEVRFDAPPITENGRTLVPMRAIFEALDMEVTWFPEERSVMAVGGDFMSFIGLSITIDSDEMISEGQSIHLDAPARLINGKTFVPLRAVSEGVSAEVVWNEAERSVSIVTGRQRGEPAVIPKSAGHSGWLYDWLSENDNVEYGEEAAVVTLTGPDPYFVLFKWIYDLDPGLNSEIKYIAVDMTEAKAADYSYYIDLMKSFCDKNGLILLEDTREGLLEKGLLKRYDEYSMRAQFDDGILISFKDISSSENKLATNITKWRSGDGAIGGRYVLEKLDGLWIITEIGGQYIS